MNLVTLTNSEGQSSSYFVDVALGDSPLESIEFQLEKEQTTLDGMSYRYTKDDEFYYFGKFFSFLL